MNTDYTDYTDSSGEWNTEGRCFLNTDCTDYTDKAIEFQTAITVFSASFLLC